MFNQFIQYAVNILFEEYTEGNPKILNFLKMRHLQIKDIEKYQIGYIRPENPIPKFINDNIEYYELVKLVKNNRILVTDRIIIPIKDNTGDYKMISCRNAKEYAPDFNKHIKSDNQKYLTPKDIGIDKNAILHGYFDNLDNIRSANEIIVTEGQYDHLTLDIFGCNYSVAISGSTFSDIHLDSINMISKSIDIVFALDNDKAGNDTLFSIILKYTELHHRLYFIDYDVSKETAKDPDEYVNKFGLQRFLDLKKPIKNFLISDPELSLKQSYMNILDEISNAIEPMYQKVKAEIDKQIVKTEIGYNHFNRNRNIIASCYSFWEYKFNLERNLNKTEYPNSYIKTFAQSEFNKEVSKLFVYIPKYTSNNLFYILYLVINKCNSIDEILKYYYFVLAYYPTVADSFYVLLLKKHLKTFESVGKFCYNIYYHKKRIHWFIERLCALWFIVAYRRRIGRYEKFEFRYRLHEYSDCGRNISDIDEYEALKEIGEIYEEPIYSEGKIMKIALKSGYTNNLIRRAAELYIRKCSDWNK